MATKAYSIEMPATGGDLPTGCFIVVWEALANGDDGAPFDVAKYPDKTVQVIGSDFGAGTVTIQGHCFASGSPTYATLRDPTGGNLTFTASGLKAVLEHVWGIRPALAGGAAGSVVVRMLISTQARR
jgi:hypothetical protein